MTFDEVENCTFEPDCGTQNPNSKYQPKNEGSNDDKSFFERLGDNLMLRHPRIYKYGIMKRAKNQYQNGEIDQSLSTLFNGFNVMKLFANFENKDHKAWVLNQKSDQTIAHKIG